MGERCSEGRSFPDVVAKPRGKGSARTERNCEPCEAERGERKRTEWGGGWWWRTRIVEVNIRIGKGSAEVIQGQQVRAPWYDKPTTVILYRR